MRYISIVLGLVFSLIQIHDINQRFSFNSDTKAPPLHFKIIAVESISLQHENFSVPTSGEVISPFGRRIGRRHTGIDIMASKGTPIRASKTGTVKSSMWLAGYGYMVAIEHTDSHITRYAHCSTLLVKKGQKVKKGQVIAKVGSTGRATGPHLHFEVIKNNKFLDPLLFLDIPLHRTYKTRCVKASAQKSFTF